MGAAQSRNGLGSSILRSTSGKPEKCPLGVLSFEHEPSRDQNVQMVVFRVGLALLPDPTEASDAAQARDTWYKVRG